MGNFSDNIVNQRFGLVYTTLEESKKIKGKSDIAKHLGTYNHVINSILKGERNITVEQLNKLFEIYNINANYMFGQSDSMFNNGQTSIATRPMTERTFEGKRNIVLVPKKASAGYAIDFGDNEFIESLQRFTIPGLSGDLVAFEISGDSMTPTITNGDIVVCEPLEKEEPLRDNHVYVIVTDTIVAKRIHALKSEDNKLVQLRLISDNGAVYKPYDVDVEEVRQILKVKCRLTAYAIS